MQVDYFPQPNPLFLLEILDKPLYCSDPLTLIVYARTHTHAHTRARTHTHSHHHFQNTQNQPAIAEPTSSTSLGGSGIKIDAPSSPKPEEDSPPAVSSNTGSNFQSNAGSTPAHVAPAAKVGQENP